MRRLEEAIGEYCRVLSRCLERTRRAEDRDRYRRHLAEAATWFGMIHGGAPTGDVLRRIRAIERAYGWGYLDGETGKAANRARGRLLDEVRGMNSSADGGRSDDDG